MSSLRCTASRMLGNSAIHRSQRVTQNCVALRGKNPQTVENDRENSLARILFRRAELGSKSGSSFQFSRLDVCFVEVNCTNVEAPLHSWYNL
jgi:hypothetical protein